MNFAVKDVRINSTYYSNLIEECRRKCQKPRGFQSWLLQDNIRFHKSTEIMSIIEKNGLVLLNRQVIFTGSDT